ncbi:MAG: cytochrome c [Epsilonproteobacteria bacterium]|nr:cytochrome c [Campylobacterota bacterium]
MKYLITFIFLGTSLCAVDGEKVYQKACASCHVKMLTKEQILQKLSTLKAPPMIEVSHQLKKISK